MPTFCHFVSDLLLLINFYKISKISTECQKSGIRWYEEIKIAKPNSIYVNERKATYLEYHFVHNE